MSTIAEVKLTAADLLASKGRYDETVEKYLRERIEPNIGTNSEIQKIIADIENPRNYNECIASAVGTGIRNECILAGFDGFIGHKRRDMD